MFVAYLYVFVAGLQAYVAADEIHKGKNPALYIGFAVFFGIGAIVEAIKSRNDY